MDILTLFTQNMLSPVMLFFALGLLAGAVKSDLSIPDQIGRFLSIYLMIAIGFKGGVAIAETPEFNFQVIAAIMAGILTGFLQPFIGYFLLTRTTQLDKVTAAAVSAHYGSISMVTFVTAASFIESAGLVYAGYIIAILALMEAPAIITGLYLAHRADPSTDHTDRKEVMGVMREIFTNGAIVLLTGSFLIGWASGPEGMVVMEKWLVEPFTGILAFFLLEMGLVVTRQMEHLKQFNIRLIAFGIYMPLIGGVIGLLLAWLIGLDVGTGTLFMVLVASASYIAVPAALKLALPEAKAAIYVPMSLAISFPFNILVGIPLYYTTATQVLG